VEVALMLVALDEQEGVPSSYPAQPSGLTTDAADLDTETLWKRIESWITNRWGERSVTWIVEGPGTWTPRLQPASIDTSEVWDGSAWQTVTLQAAPMGYELDAKTYRVTATVGSTESVPAELNEAYRRLAEYLADDSYLGRVATSGTRDLSDMQITSERPAAWQAKALHYSGAADVLRKWRR
jgi:hypothetical protein